MPKKIGYGKNWIRKTLRRIKQTILNNHKRYQRKIQRERFGVLVKVNLPGRRKLEIPTNGGSLGTNK